MLQYWLSVVLKTLWDSLAFIQKTPHELLFATLLVVLTGIVHLVSRGWHGLEDFMKEFLFDVLKGLVIAIVGFAIIYVFHFPWEPYHIQDDLYRNRAALQSDYDKRQWKHLSCSADLQTARVSVQLLSDRVGSQQQMINSAQGNLSSQQGTMNKCMTTLGELEKPERLKITPFSLGVLEDRKNPSVALYSTNYILLTNKIITPVRLIVTCEPGLVQVGAGVLGTGATIGGGWNIVPTPKRVGVGFSSPAWTPESPMLVTVYSNEQVSGCYFLDQ